MRYCITGGLGFTGNELVRQLVQQGMDVFIIDNFSKIAPDADDLNGVEKYECDIRNLPALKEIFSDKKPDKVIHLAATHYIPECNAMPDLAFDVNVTGTLNLLICSEIFQVPHSVVISSGAIYEDSDEMLTEDISPIGFFDVYSLTKKVCEELTALYSKRNPLLYYSAVRLFNTYGPRETNPHIIPEIIKQIKETNTLFLGNILPRRDLIHVADVAKGLIKIAGRRLGNPFEIVNLCTGADVSVKDIIDIFQEFLKKEIVIKTDVSKLRPYDKMYQKGSKEKLFQLTGFQTSVDIRKGLEELLRYEGFL